jgi:hypothetical protein
MRRSEYLFQLILGGVGISTLFKTVAVIAMLLVPDALTAAPGPMTQTFARAASVPVLIQDLRPLLGLLRAEGADGIAGTPDRGSTGLIPNDQSIVAVLNAEPCFTAEGMKRLEAVGLADGCTPETRAVLERQVRWWSLVGGVIIILLGSLGWWADDMLRRRYLESGLGYPQSVEVLKARFEAAIGDATRVIEDSVPSDDRPRSHADLTSGQFEFLAPDPNAIRDPRAPGMTFWLVSGLVVAGSALTALSGGVIVAGIMMVIAFLALIITRVIFDHWRGQGAAYVLAYRVVPQSAAPDAKEPGSALPADADPAASAAVARSAIIGQNVRIYHEYIGTALKKLAEQDRDDGSKRLLLPLIIGLLALLVGNWVGGGLIHLINGQFGTGVWTIGEGLAAPETLWSALGALDPAARPVLLSVFALGLIVSFGLAIWSDRRVSRAGSASGARFDPARIIAISAAWLLAVYVASVLTWLSGVQLPSVGGPVLVRGGLVCDVRSVNLPSAEDPSATWAFDDPDRPAFKLEECTVNHLMRYPQPTLSELTRAAQPAEVAFVIGLASFEGQVATQEQLAASRAVALARAMPAGQNPPPIYGLLLGRSLHPAVSTPSPRQGSVTFPTSESADQRKVLVYLAGRRGVRTGALSAHDVQGLLRGIRADLQARDTDPGQYSTCLVQQFDRRTGEFSAVTDAALNATFCAAT